MSLLVIECHQISCQFEQQLEQAERDKLSGKVNFQQRAGWQVATDPGAALKANLKANFKVNLRGIFSSEQVASDPGVALKVRKEKDTGEELY